MHMQGVILKEHKDSLELVLDMEEKANSGSQVDENLRKQAGILKEQALAKKERALQELEMDFRKKEAQMDRTVSERLFVTETQKMQWLKEEQLKEKKEIMDRHLPHDSALKDVMDELVADEAHEIQEFKKDQEIERQRREEELAKQQAQVLKEIAEQK